MQPWLVILMLLLTVGMFSLLTQNDRQETSTMMHLLFAELIDQQQESAVLQQ